MPLLVLGLLSPVLLLGLTLWMARVEEAMPKGSFGDDVLAFLDDARPDEIEALVTDGLGVALEKYWRRRRFARLVPGLAP